MDAVLHDLQKSLRKLEGGQLQIESGVLELHKDVTIIAKGLEEVKEMKDDFAEIKKNTLEQMDIVKELHAKLKNNNMSSEVSLKSIDDKTRPKKNCIFKNKKTSSPKAVKENRSELFHSKQFVLTSQRNAAVSGGNSSEKTSVEKVRVLSEEDMEELEDASKQSNSGSSEVDDSPPCIVANREVLYDCHDDEILQRYLNDSAKYAGKEEKTQKESDFDSGAGHHQQTNGTKRRGKTAGKSGLSKKLSVKGTKVSAHKADNTKSAKTKLTRGKASGKGSKNKNLSEEKDEDEAGRTKEYGKYKCKYCNRAFCFSTNFTEHLKSCRMKPDYEENKCWGC